MLSTALWDWKQYHDGSMQGWIELPVGTFSIECLCDDRKEFRVRVIGELVDNRCNELEQILIELPERYKGLDTAKGAGMVALIEFMESSIKILKSG